MPHPIHIGVGGWTYEPWRGTFFPEDLPQSKELAFAANALTAIEINGTFYRTQTPATFRKWAEAVPEGFIFALKAPRYVSTRRILAETGESIKRFLYSGRSWVRSTGNCLRPASLTARIWRAFWTCSRTS